jgi:aminopeptidase
MFEENLAKYADLIVKVGINLQPGQRLIIGMPHYRTTTEAAPLVHEVTRSAYEAGAKLVTVLWDTPQMLQARLNYAPEGTLGEYEDWLVEGVTRALKEGDAGLYIVSPQPGSTDSLDADRVSQYTTGLTTFGMDVRRTLMAHTNYSIVACPNPAWADRIGISMEDFWDDVFSICRVTADDPVAAWEAHTEDLNARSGYLNDLELKALHFKGPGTNLTIGLAYGHRWLSALALSVTGLPYAVNMPTEEVFTTPHRENVEGFVTATKPLVYRDTIIDRFSLTFKGGRVVSASAEQGETLLHSLLNVDETVRHLGEVALVPSSSPISRTGRIYYNILYDENATCHAGLGNSYRTAVKGGTEMSDEEYAQAGGNTAPLHADFMLGSPEVDVDGILANGSTEPLMRDGEWAFEA